MDLQNNRIPIGVLLQNPKACEIIAREFPGVLNHPMLKMARRMSLGNVLSQIGNAVPREKIERVLGELQALCERDML